MPGKSAGNSLTGGTGDVNPQWYKLTVVDNTGAQDTSGVNTALGPFVQQTFPLPIPRNRNAGGNKATVVEVLKLKWDVTILDNSGYGGFAGGTYKWAGGTVYVNSQLTTKSWSSQPPLSDGTIIDSNPAAFYTSPTLFFSSTASDGVVAGGESEEGIHILRDLTDSAGHGLLVATDNVYLSQQVGVLSHWPAVASPFAGGNFQTIGYNVTGCSTNCQMLYRFKNVTLEEYIGIVQSQQ